MKRAILLIAHGSRLAEANEDLRWLADQLRQRHGGRHVEVAYLELAEPNIETGARRCVELGAEEVVLLPCFLSAGHHVRTDLEGFRSKLAARHPNVRWRLCEAIGRHPLLVDILFERLHTAED